LTGLAESGVMQPGVDYHGSWGDEKSMERLKAVSSLTSGGAGMNLHTPRLAEFLARQTGKQYCATCLALELPCSDREVRNALAPGATDVALNRGAGQCARCRGWNLVYGVFAPDAEARAPEERLAEFLQPRTGTFFCNTCLCRELRISPHVVRRAVDRLRMAGTARLQGGRCVICERLKLVIGSAVGEDGGTFHPGIA
jgi:hypothetical protein